MEEASLERNRHGSAPLLSFPGGAAVLVRSASSDWFRFAETRHTPNQRLARHAHENATVSVVLRGATREEAPSAGSLECEAGNVLVRPAGSEHADFFGPAGTTNLEIELLPGTLSALRRRTPLFDAHGRHTAPQLHELARRIRAEMAVDDGASLLALEGLTLELLAAASRDRAGAPLPAPPAWLRRVRDLLREECGSPFRLLDLAREAGVSPTHLARAFRRHFGVTPGTYLRRARVDRAARAIEEGAAPLAQVAAEAGFADQSHMGRAFRRERGTSPARLRARVS